MFEVIVKSKNGTVSYSVESLDQAAQFMDESEFEAALQPSKPLK